MYKVYSFDDVNVTIIHPSVGQYIANGQGIGTLTITRANDNTAHELAADGSVMISKIKARNGNCAIAIQQTSDFHTWLKRWFNYLEFAAPSEWAETVIIVRSPNMQVLDTLTGVSPQKPGDQPFQQQGQNVTWTLMAADVQLDTV